MKTLLRHAGRSAKIQTCALTLIRNEFRPVIEGGTLRIPALNWSLHSGPEGIRLVDFEWYLYWSMTNPGVLPGRFPGQARPDVQVFIPVYPQQVGGGQVGLNQPPARTFPRQWIMPPGASWVMVTAIGAGGGGGSGGKQSTTTSTSGGGGGGSGAWSRGEFLAESLPGEVDIWVSNGGNGGAAVAANTSSGNGGSSGSSSTFGGGLPTMLGVMVMAGGAGNGGGGSGAAAGNAGSAPTFGMALGVIGAAGTQGATGANGTDVAVGVAGHPGAAGGGGGGLSNTNVPAPGGRGGCILNSNGNTVVTWNAGGTIAPTAGGNGQANTYMANMKEAATKGYGWQGPNSRAPMGGYGGGGGGASNNSTAAGNGGHGGHAGGGGGGGGAATNTTTPSSGAGGAGGDGVLVIVCL